MLALVYSQFHVHVIQLVLLLLFLPLCYNPCAGILRPKAALLYSQWLYLWVTVLGFLFPSPLSLPCCFQVAQTVSLSLSPILGLYTVLGSNYPLSGFTAFLSIQKTFVSQDFLNSPRSCSDFFSSSMVRSNWNAEVPLASPWYSCPPSGIEGFSLL